MYYKLTTEQYDELFNIKRVLLVDREADDPQTQRAIIRIDRLAQAIMAGGVHREEAANV